MSNASNNTIQVWYNNTNWNASSPLTGTWTSWHSTTVTGAGFGSWTTLTPTASNLLINPGQTVAFMVRATVATSLRYDNPGPSTAQNMTGLGAGSVVNFRNGLSGGTGFPTSVFGSPRGLCIQLYADQPNLSITGITLSTGATAQLDSSFAVGDSVFTDRTFTWASVGTIGGKQWIRTPNNDKNNTAASYLQFTVNTPVTVYVLYDERATALPNWMSTFTNTGQLLTITGDVSRNVYSKTYPAGTITLGGNLATGAAGAGSNYSVVVSQ